MNRMEQAVDRLKQRMQDSVGKTVVYHRANASTNVVLWLGGTAFRITDQGNSRLIWSDRDYLIPVENLKINNVLVTPEYGDWIEEIIDGVTFAYELSAPQGEQAWRYADHEHKIYRLHTKQMNR